MEQIFRKICETVDRNGIFADGDWIESKDQDPQGDIRLIQLADIGDGVFVNKSARFLTRTRADELRCTYLNKGDVLVSRMPEPLGRACVFPLNEQNAYVTAVDVCIIRTSSNLPEYIAHAINSPQIRNAIWRSRSGTTRQRITRSKLGEMLIPLPPLPEQERIVAKLNGIFEHVDSSIRLLERNLADIDAMAASVLDETFHHEALPEGWESRTVKECLDEKSYSVGKVQTKEYCLAGKFPIIDQSQKAIAGYCDRDDLTYDGKLPVLVYGDHTNSVKYVDFRFVSGADGTKVLNPQKDISAKYLFHAIGAFKPKTQGYRRHFPILKDVRIPLPPLAEQERIVAKLDAFFAEQKAAKAKYESQITELKALKSSILSSAFRGEI